MTTETVDHHYASGQLLEEFQNGYFVDAEAVARMNRSELARQNLFSYRVDADPSGLSSTDIDLDHATDIEGPRAQGLLGVVTVGEDAAVKVYGKKKVGEDGFDTHRIILTHADFDPTNHEDNRFVIVGNNDDPTVFGRTGRGAALLGIGAHQGGVSREHFQVQLSDGRVRISDLGSTNGTRFITVPGNTEQRGVYQEQHAVKTQPRVVGGPVVQREADIRSSHEWMLDGASFKLEGTARLGSRDVYAVRSVDEFGTSREFLVYRSHSEGSWRSSPGYHVDEGVILKGAGRHNPKQQYTQETQLNPRFAHKLGQSIRNGEGSGTYDIRRLQFSESVADDQEVDFALQITTDDFPDKKLATTLTKLDAGVLSRKDIAHKLGVEENSVDNVLGRYVNELNKTLRKSGVMPDFSGMPSRIEDDEHPILGRIRREVYTHTVKGKAYEWHMAYDSSGRTWVDRIRYADSGASAYGTDSRLVDSGILTSKPLEYLPGSGRRDVKDQASGVPLALRGMRFGNYVDITPFLAQMEPVKQFRMAKGFLN